MSSVFRIGNKQYKGLYLQKRCCEACVFAIGHLSHIQLFMVFA